jgi:NitT/TauT family transport system substrate-binding protein
MAGLEQGFGQAEPGSALPEPSLVKVTLATDWYPEAEQGGFYQALAKGYYRDAGLDVTIVPGGPGSFPVPSLATGKIPFCLAASDEIVMDVSHGLPLVIVGAFLQHYPAGVLIHDESPIRGFADLDHAKVIGVPGAGWIALVQKKYHVQFDLIPMGFDIARFLADKDVVQQCYITNEPYYVAKNGVKARTLMISDSGYDPYRVVITNRTYLKAHPEVVRAFMAATIRGWNDFAYNDPAPAIDAIIRLNTKTDRAFVEDSLSVMKKAHLIAGKGSERVGQMLRDRLDGQMKMMADIGQIDAPYPVEKLASFDFSPEGVPPPAGH